MKVSEVIRAFYVKDILQLIYSYAVNDTYFIIQKDGKNYTVLKKIYNCSTLLEACNYIRNNDIYREFLYCDPAYRIGWTKNIAEDCYIRSSLFCEEAFKLNKPHQDHRYKYMLYMLLSYSQAFKRRLI
jgi:hypothetical protein